MPAAVQVVNENGDVMGNVKIGDTRDTVLNRYFLEENEGFGLFDNANIALCGSDTVSFERGPYVIKEIRMIHQPTTTPSCKRQKVLLPPSDGKMASNQPSKKNFRGPSSEEGQTDAMKYVDEAANLEGGHALYCSANSIAMRVISLLENEVNSYKEIPSKYIDAAKTFLIAREMLHDKNLDIVGVKSNERHYYTGAFCLALNAVLDGGMAALRRGCIGAKATHSDIHARYVLDGYKSPVLMVGEGKIDSDKGIRESVCGQLFNELIRHRKIDRTPKVTTARFSYCHLTWPTFR